MSVEERQSLKSRFQEARTGSEIQKILEQVAAQKPTRWLEMRVNKGVITLKGSLAPIIVAIEFDSKTRAIKTPLVELAAPFLGKADSVDQRSKLLKIISRSLIEKGYPKPKVNLRIQDKEEEVAYKFVVEEGEPCLIKRVRYPFVIPKSVDSLNLVGELCDKELIENAIQDLNEALYEKGFKQATLSFQSLTMDTANLGEIRLNGQLGHIIEYEIDDPSSRIRFADLFAGDELKNVDPNIIGPEAMASEIKNKYRSQGFDDIQVLSPRVVRESREKVKYIYKVNVGKQYFVQTIQLEGLQAFSRAEALEIMQVEQGITDTSLDLLAVPVFEVLGFKKILDVYPELNRDAFNRGIERLINSYKAEGYWKVKIPEPRFIKDNQTGTATVVITIEEGPQHIYDGITIQGNEFLTQDEIQEFMAIEKGDAMDRRKLEQFQKSLRESYLSQGYLHFEGDLKLLGAKNNNKIPTKLVVRIKENKRVKIGQISIRGTSKTHPKVISRELRFSEGDWYNNDVLTKSRKAIIDLGLFRSVQIRPSSNAILEKAENIDIEVEVREAKPGRVIFGPGFSVDRGLRYSFESLYSNLGGVGRQVSLRTLLSQEKNQKAISNKTMLGRTVSLGFLEPYLFDLPVNGSVSTSSRARAREIWEISNGFEVALIHPFRTFLEGAHVSSFYNFRINREEGSQEQETNLTATGNVKIGQVGLRFSHDTRNHKAWPSSGFTLDSEISWARFSIGSDLRFFQWRVQNNHFFELSTRWALALGLQVAGYEDIERKGNDDRGDVLPASERLHAGGAETVRGYEPRDLGPIVRFPSQSNCAWDTSVLGGTHRTIVKLELRHRLKDWFATSGFVDSGNTFLSPKEKNKFVNFYSSQRDTCPARKSVEDNFYYNSEKFVTSPTTIYQRHYVSYGLALNLLTPIGPINVAFGIPWLEPKSERCRNSEDLCFPRSDLDQPWYKRGKLHVNVSTRF